MMFFRDVLRISTANAIRGRVRALLTALSIAIGVSSVMLISTLGDSGTMVINGELDKLGINGITLYANKSTGAEDLQVADAMKIEESVPEIESAQPLVIEMGSYRLKNKQGSIVLWGVDANIQEILGVEILYGRMPNASDVKFSKNVVVIDQALAQKNYKRDNIVGKNIVICSAGNIAKFEVVGIIRSQKDGINQIVGGAIPEFAYMPYTTLNNLRSATNISQIAIKCRDNSIAEEAGNHAVEVLSRYHNKPGGYGSENVSGHVDKLKNIAGLVALLISAIAAISLCVAGLGIMNTMLASTAERRKEIGICMAIGAKRRDIAICFLTESALISAAGGTVGALIGLGISALVTTIFHMPNAFSISKILIAESVSIFCGIIFAVIPALRASKLDPIVVLRDQ